MRHYVGGMYLLTDINLIMRTDPLALTRDVSEFVTVIFGPAVTFALPDSRVKTYRRSLPRLNLISSVDGSTLTWFEQNVLREATREDLLFGKASERDMMSVNFNQ